MTDQNIGKLGELSVDTENLYREETFTDMHAASVRRLTPVKPNGKQDGGRPIVYIGETTLMTQLGPLPVQFPIEADSLKDAFAQFPEGVKGAVERLNERAKEMALEESSRIVVPSAMPPGAAGGIPGAGVPGKIILDK